MTWRKCDFSPDCVLVVLADSHYDESDYYRHYDDFCARRRRRLRAFTIRLALLPVSARNNAKKLCVAHKTLLALLHDLAVLVALSAVVRPRTAALSFVSQA